MTKPEIAHFHVRMPKRLKDELHARVGKSLNEEIVQRLERSVEHDPAMQIADALRPLLAGLGDEELEKMVELVAQAAQILTKTPRKKK